MKLIKNIANNISKTLLTAFFILLLGGTITYYQTRLAGIEIPKQTTVIVASQKISKGDEITGTHLKEKVIDEKYKHKGSYSKMSEIIGKVALTDLIADKEITASEITTKEQWFRPEEKEVGITFEKFTDLVGGTAKPGDVVDVMLSLSLEETGGVPAAPEMIVAGVELKNVFDESNIAYKNAKDKNAFKPITVLVKLDNEMDAAVDQAKKKGKLYLKRHGNVIKVDEDPSTENTDKVIISGKRKDGE
ncbi:SAF domain-containing protein [Geosporobacter ferrireducens]|uniref:SAF domain-containing protein n=1 Tax=Geosporobacter ferrireducens TaxID=1424294 RepID=UPI00139D32A9|nr:SAF domain-containing protein [Geosporobacter ferrireducens]MTI53795.1 hypothetical protein [Geosporobacter ferrireducens]